MIKISHNSALLDSSVSDEKTDSSTARTLGKPPPHTTDLPLQISTTPKTVKPCTTNVVTPVLNFFHTTSSIPALLYYLTDTFTWRSTSLIYCIICSKCSKMYVGQTSKSVTMHSKSVLCMYVGDTWFYPIPRQLLHFNQVTPTSTQHL